MVDHVIFERHLAVLITNDGEGKVGTRDLVDVLDPSSMRLDRIGRQTDQLDTTLLEFRLELGKGAELSSADGSVVLGVGEEDNPAVTNELVEVDGTSGRVGLEVGCDGSQTEGGIYFSSHVDWWDLEFLG